MRFNLPISEMTSLEFLKEVAELRLPFEVSFVEEDGDGVVATGVVDQEGRPSAGAEDIIERHAKGRISIHSHVGQEEADLIPSPGDMEVLGLNRIYNKQRNPAIIINSTGMLVFGLDPDFEKREQQENSPGKYSWQIKNRTQFKFQGLSIEVQSGKKTFETAMQEYFEFLTELGVIKFRKQWNDFTSEDLEVIREGGKTVGAGVVTKINA